MTQLSHKVGHVPIQFLSSYTYKRLGLSSQQGIHTHTHTLIHYTSIFDISGPCDNNVKKLLGSILWQSRI